MSEGQNEDLVVSSGARARLVLSPEDQALVLEIASIDPTSPPTSLKLMLTLDTLQGLIQQLQDGLRQLESYHSVTIISTP